MQLSTENVMILDKNGDTIQSLYTVKQGAESSVEISQTAKGEHRVNVKVYHADPDLAAEAAIRIYKETAGLLKHE